VGDCGLKEEVGVKLVRVRRETDSVLAVGVGVGVLVGWLKVFVTVGAAVLVGVRVDVTVDALGVGLAVRVWLMKD